jgi:hypothetical protein
MGNKIYHQDTKTPRYVFSNISTLCLGVLVVKSKVFKTILITTFVLISFSFPSSAEMYIYKWTDDKGVVHVTDDPTKIPDKYWIEKKVKKEEVKPTPEAVPSQPVQPSPAPETRKEELYGDYPLDWWIYKFKGLRKDIAESEGRIEQARNFISVFETGRRYGTVFTNKEVLKYERYKAALPSMEEKLKQLKDELEELQRKARIYGVPREVRE